MGRGYVIEYCISTFNTMQKDEAYRAYLSEIFRAISKQLGMEFKHGYFEVIDSMKPQKEEMRTADDVIDSIKSKANKIRGN